MRQTKRILCIALTLWFLTPQTRAQEDANSILDVLRSKRAQVDQALSCRLRTEQGDSIPFSLQLKGAEFSCKFTNPPETIKVLLTETGSVLTEQPTADQSLLSSVKSTETVRGTDITYEDLSLRFIYWKNAKYEGEQRVRTIPCSIVIVEPSSLDTAYSAVRLWITKNRGGLIKAEGLNQQGKAIKRFEVISAQQIDGQTIFKQVRIERLDPQNGKVLSRTYFEVDSGAV